MSDRYQDFSTDDLLTHARQASRNGEGSLREAAAVYRHLLGRKLDHYVKGRLFRDLWAIEQRLGNYREYFSQAGQDRLIDQDLFKGKRDGVFLEIGGYDGITGSNCLHFESFKSWRGVIVEAVPTLAEEISKIRAAPVIQAALCGHDGAAELLHVTAGYRQMSGLIDSYDDGTLGQVRGDPRHREERLTVPALRLETLLRNQGLERIDYCSLDVEGAERVILADFDFSAFQIGVLSIENTTGTAADSLRDIMAPAGYRLVAIIGADEIWSRL